jgi:hypothetical protein
LTLRYRSNKGFEKLNWTNVKSSIHSSFKLIKTISRKKESNGWNSRPKSTTLDFPEKKCFKKPRKGEKQRAARLERLNWSRKKS